MIAQRLTRNSWVGLTCLEGILVSECSACVHSVRRAGKVTCTNSNSFALHVVSLYADLALERTYFISKLRSHEATRMHHRSLYTPLHWPRVVLDVLGVLVHPLRFDNRRSSAHGASIRWYFPLSITCQVRWLHVPLRQARVAENVHEGSSYAWCACLDRCGNSGHG